MTLNIRNIQGGGYQKTEKGWTKTKKQNGGSGANSKTTKPNNPIRNKLVDCGAGPVSHENLMKNTGLEESWKPMSKKEFENYAANIGLDPKDAEKDVKTLEKEYGKWVGRIQPKGKFRHLAEDNGEDYADVFVDKKGNKHVGIIQRSSKGYLDLLQPTAYDDNDLNRFKI